MKVRNHTRGLTHIFRPRCCWWEAASGLRSSVSWLPQNQAAYLNQGSLDKAFLYLLLGTEGTTLTDPAAIQPAIRAALTGRNARYIIDHDNVAGPWLEQFGGWPVVYIGDEVVVYGDRGQ